MQIARQSKQISLMQAQLLLPSSHGSFQKDPTHAFTTVVTCDMSSAALVSRPLLVGSPLFVVDATAWGGLRQ